MKEFNTAFLYKNRHYLYTEDAEQVEFANPDLCEKINKESKYSSAKKSKQNSSRRSFHDREDPMRASTSFNIKTEIVDTLENEKISVAQSLELRASLPPNQSGIDDLLMPESPEQIVSVLSDSIDSSSAVSLKQDDCKPSFDLDKFKVETARCILEVKIFIEVIKETIIRFYYMENRVKSRVAKE